MQKYEIRGWTWVTSRKWPQEANRCRREASLEVHWVNGYSMPAMSGQFVQMGRGFQGDGCGSGFQRAPGFAMGDRLVGKVRYF